MRIISGKYKGKRIPVSKGEPLKEELVSFRDCVKNDVNPAVSGEDALISLDMVLNILKAAKNKNSVKVNGGKVD